MIRPSTTELVWLMTENARIRGLTLQNFLELCGIKYLTFYNWKKGYSNPLPETEKRIRDRMDRMNGVRPRLGRIAGKKDEKKSWLSRLWR